MRFPRKIAFLLLLAFLLAMGQQAGLLHGLAHATERVSQKQDSKPATSACEQCSLCAQLTGLAGATAEAALVVAALVPAAAFVVRAAPVSTRLAFRSRAPPVLL